MEANTTAYREGRIGYDQYFRQRDQLKYQFAEAERGDRILHEARLFGIKLTAPRGSRTRPGARVIDATEARRVRVVPLEVEDRDPLADPLAPARERQEARPWLRPSWILGSALVIMVGFQQLTGWSAPFGFSGVPESWRPKDAPPKAEQGDHLTQGAQDFTEAVASLQAAPPQTWRGEEAADAYVAATKTLMGLAQQTADMDQQTHGAVRAQADAVDETRFILGMEQDFLILMLAVVLYVEQTCVAPVFPLWLWRFAWGVSFSALGAGAGQLIACSEQSKRHGATARTMQYDEVTTAAQRVIAGCVAVPAPPAGAGATAGVL